ncbi:hypothetical protein P4393_12365 [Bacillus subtilis]|nr:hypothetical protein [Bacillus subtilis]MED3474621.1 hypothetical protein [Bacillus subtilis]
MSDQQNKLKDDFRKDLVRLKSTAESYVVLSLYKTPELYFDNNISVDDFHDSVWKFYFAIAKKAIKSGRKVLDDVIIGLTVGENEQLQKMYDECGGYQTIATGMTFVKEENFDSYLTDVKKYNALIRLHDVGYPIMDKYDVYKVMSADAIQEALEGMLSSIFADVEVEEQVEDLRDGLWGTVMDAHEGKLRGFPYESALLNDYVNGQALGNITMVSANSGVGKTFFTLAEIFPNMIKFNEKLLIMANEEDKAKWQKEIITWAVNNMVGGEFLKNRFNKGEFTADELTLLRKAVDWLNKQMQEGIINFVNFNSFSMSKAIKTIKKNAAIHDIKYYVLDTLKLDSDAINANTQAWLQLQQGMVKLYDVVKPSNKNLHVWVTYQLGKSAMLNRYLSQNSLGVSKNVVDVVSTLILVRKALQSEKEGGNNEVKVKLPNGVYTKMSPDKEYFIVFLGKNRMGPTNYQLVFEIDMGRNIVKDFGTCIIEQDI